jgi:predicted deacylase
MNNPIWATVDYERKGKQTGDLYLPHSVNRSAYGNITIPIAVVAGGSGPTMLLTGGTHGDEYEGPIAYRRLIAELDPAQLNGRLIILPHLNAPAARAATRVSPEDQGNLNRAFPGEPFAGPTATIAHYLSTVLLPMADFFHDAHAGGSSLNYLPFVSMRKSGDPELDAKALSAARAYGATNIQIWGYSPDPRLSTSESNRQKVVSLGGEFGGGGAVSRPGVAMVERGVRRLLTHLRMVEGTLDDAPIAREFEVQGRDHYVYAQSSGLFEASVELGDSVSAGAVCGSIWDIEDLSEPARLNFFARGGTVMCLRHPALVRKGDCIAHLATEIGR